jgi:hypothetical protein
MLARIVCVEALGGSRVAADAIRAGHRKLQEIGAMTHSTIYGRGRALSDERAVPGRPICDQFGRAND